MDHHNTTNNKGNAPIEKTERYEKLVRSLANGDRSFHKLPSDLSADEAAAVRRAALERMSGSELEGTGSYSFDAEQVSSHNCENLIGAAHIPVGTVGPIPIHGQHVDGEEEIHVPLATTEGALVASVNRGCAALRNAGGATVDVEDVGMTRAPVFRTSGIKETRKFVEWVNVHEHEIRAFTESTSRYLKLLDIRPFSFGTTVFLRFRFKSGDAMGMNMATLACDQVIEEYITPSTGIQCVSLSGNYCVDKKPAQVNAQEGRGKQIHAEVVLDASTVEKYLKTNAADLTEVQYRKNLLGSQAAGSMGMNAHHANMVAAFFIATGQDVAQVVEGSLGTTCVEQRDNGSVFFSIFMPDVPLGAIGGGTGLRTQQEALSMMNVSPDPDNPGQAAMRLAEILGATVLAGELSLMGALSSNHLASAHRTLARNTPTSVQDAQGQDIRPNNGKLQVPSEGS